jgi:excisionase family DNA binding protein
MAENHLPDGHTDVPKLVGVAYPAELLGVRPAMVYRMVAEGILPHVRIGRRSIRFSPEALNQFIQANMVGGQAGTR